MTFSFRTRTALALLAALALAPALSADDRALLRAGSREPYVFVILDSSGSMNWSPPCSAADYAAGVCNYLCPSADCPVPRDGDDPASKMRQAKEALYEVISGVTTVEFGFATYNQDQLRVDWKTWLYQVDPTQTPGFISLAGGALFPAAGSQEVFGATFACDRNGGGIGGNADEEIGCYANQNRAADVNDVWEMTKVRRLAKLGDAGSSTVPYYVRSAGQVYRVETLVHTAPPAPGPLGNTNITMHYHVLRCTGTPLDNPTNGCNAAGEFVSHADQNITYTLVGDFAKWDNDVDRNPDEGGFDQVAYVGASNTCTGWDSNTDDGSDVFGNGYSLRFPDEPLPLYRGVFDPPGTANDGLFLYGDVIPLNWGDSNGSSILERLAPALNGGLPSSDPEAFGNARYLRNHRQAGDNFLRLTNAGDRPIFPSGSTPLGNSLNSVLTWYRAWDNFAAVQDEDWECRKKYVLLITDGDETCNSDPCAAATGLFGEDVLTYAVGFGLSGGAGNTLNCIAANGGTGEPIFPQNRQELIDALNAIFDEIEEGAVTFASAAVPSVQANIADKIFLSSFTPLNDESVWPGRIDAFLKPLPLDDANLPDRSVLCVAGSVEAECFAWDAGDAQPAWDTDPGYLPRGLLLQAPLPEDIVAGNNASLKIGSAVDERRVFFGLPRFAAPGNRQYFRFPDPAVPAEQLAFEFAWNLPPPAGSAANLAEIERVIEFTLAEKRASITDPISGTTSHIQYVMGDVFHANPVVLNPPGNLDLFNKDLYWSSGVCGMDPVESQEEFHERLSYQYFSFKNFCRRAMLLTSSNDGQFHVFDAGIFRGADCRFNLPEAQQLREPAFNALDDDLFPGLDGDYDFGTGREIFSFIPNGAMPHVKALSELSNLTTQYGIDGNLSIADVFIDPVPQGTPVENCHDRQWRTVVLGTYREGGPGVFALDMTQPDENVTAGNVPTPLANGYVPSCIDGGTNCGPVPFPTMLWEFTDVTDEDGVGGADLAEGWSQPFVARIRVCVGGCASGYVDDRWVAIFGGGLPETPTNTAADESGNWVYMVDIETGAILYKRGGAGVVTGSVAADVAGVDFNSDGYTDTLYFGTTAGLLYKVALGDGPFELDSVGRILEPTGTSADPFLLFTTGGRPIYLEVTAINVAKLRATGLLFGTGNRWDLWDSTGADGRLYAIVDLGFADTDGNGVVDVDTVTCPGCTEPLTEANYERIDPDSAFDILNPGPDYLFGNADPNKLAGYFFDLAPNEKLITEPFSLAGITSFTFFDPVTTAEEGACASGGQSKIFIVNTANAVGYVPVTGGPNSWSRYFTAAQFTTQPYAEPSTTQNQGGDPPPTAEIDDVITHQLKKLMPADCKWSRVTVDIKTIRSDTGIVHVASVPVCIEVNNWKEF